MSEEFQDAYNLTAGKSDKVYIIYETPYEYITNTFSEWLNTNNIQRPVIV